MRNMAWRLTTDDGFTLEQVPAEDIRLAYQWIESDLYEITERSYADWIPADIYSSLKTGTATLSMGYTTTQQYVGFLVTCLIHDAGGRPTLFVWAVHQSHKHNYKEQVFDFLEQIARELGAESIEFHSSRPGWERVASRQGFEMVAKIYKRDLI